MIKKEDTQQPAAENVSPSFVAELVKTGTAVLEAPTREELAEMVNEIPADCKYSAGAVGQSFEHGTFTLRIDLVKP